MQQNEEKCPRCPNGWLAKIIISGVPLMACDECKYTEDIDEEDGLNIKNL